MISRIHPHDKMKTANETPPKTRFTRDGSTALEAHLARICRRVADEAQKLVPALALEAVVLGGGYGRGQGGVLRTDEGDRPYNDMEFYVFIRGNVLLSEWWYRAAFDELGERLSPESGAHVEFKILSAEKLRRSPVTMFSYDLAAGHKVIFGNEEIFRGCEHHLWNHRIPLHEATRLLFNRCSGLLLAKNFLRAGSLTREQTDFVARNLAKAELAFGDAVLTAFRQYHWSCVERAERLGRLAISESPSWLADVRRHHARGVEFKLHPACAGAPKAQLEREHAEITRLGLRLWLWVESRRLSRNFLSAREYAQAGEVKCPEIPARRNWLLNLRTFGIGALRDRRIFRYPRERLFDALCLMLWDGDALDEPALKRRLRHDLQAPTSEWPDLIPAYRNIWQGYG